MKNLFNNITPEERKMILEMHGSNTHDELDEQLGAGVKAAASGFGQRVKTIGQNLKMAVSPNQGKRIINSPKLNAALQRVKSRTNSLQKIVNDLTLDLDKILTITNEEKSGQFKYEAEQIEALVNGFKQVLSQTTSYNTQINNTELQAPTLQAPTAQTAAPVSGEGTPTGAQTTA